MNDDVEKLLDFMERALPFLEKMLKDNSDSDLEKIVTDINDFIVTYYDYT